MATIRLSRHIKDTICARLIKHRFTGDVDKLVVSHAELAQEVYDDIFTKDQQTQMQALPKGWLPVEDNVSVQFDGDFTRLNFNGSGFLGGTLYNLSSGRDRRDPVTKVVTYHVKKSCAKLYEPSHRLAKLHKRLTSEVSTIQSDVQLAQRSIYTVLNSVSTVSALVKVWPQISEFIPDMELEEKTTLPALRAAELNKTLNISEAA